MPIGTKTIRILMCDDHALLRDGVATLLSTEPDLKLIAEASNGEEAIEKFRMHHPDVTLMDLQMPGLSGIDAIARIRSEFPDARIIVLTTYTGDSQVIGALRAGARAYQLKAHVHRELPEISTPLTGSKHSMLLLCWAGTPAQGGLARAAFGRPELRLATRRGVPAAVREDEWASG